MAEKTGRGLNREEALALLDKALADVDPEMGQLVTQRNALWTRLLMYGRNAVKDPEFWNEKAKEGWGLLPDLTGPGEQGPLKQLGIVKSYNQETRDILVELGKRKVVGGQEDMIVEVAMMLAEKQKQGARA